MSGWQVTAFFYKIPYCTVYFFLSKMSQYLFAIRFSVTSIWSSQSQGKDHNIFMKNSIPGSVGMGVFPALNKKYGWSKEAKKSFLFLSDHMEPFSGNEGQDNKWQLFLKGDCYLLLTCVLVRYSLNFSIMETGDSTRCDPETACIQNYHVTC